MSYRSTELAFQRLKAEYDEHKNLVIAIDFDNTVYDTHGRQVIDLEVLYCIQAAYDLGLELFCFTANNDYELVRDFWDKVMGMPKVKINESSLDHLFGGRKPFYSLLLDDRAGLGQATILLRKIVDYVNRN